MSKRIAFALAAFAAVGVFSAVSACGGGSSGNPDGGTGATAG